GSGCSLEKLQKYKDTQNVMGTQVSVTVFSRDPKEAQQAIGYANPDDAIRRQFKIENISYFHPIDRTNEHGVAFEVDSVQFAKGPIGEFMGILAVARPKQSSPNKYVVSEVWVIQKKKGFLSNMGLMEKLNPREKTTREMMKINDRRVKQWDNLNKTNFAVTLIDFSQPEPTFRSGIINP
ncbi:hypothetical protein BVX98_05630, partial [bacterium F11]